VADKNFKVKTGLELPQPLSPSQGGTGQSSLSNLINSLLPSQPGNVDNILSTDGTNPIWIENKYSRVELNGSTISPRKTLNFIGATISDDSTGNKTNVIIGSSQYSQVLLVQNITGMTIL
jgi:hypothetical protein